MSTFGLFSYMPDLCCSVKFMPKFGNTAMVGGNKDGGIHMADEEESYSCSEFGEDGVQYRASAHNAIK